MAELQEPEASEKSTDTKAIGLIGAILISAIEAISVPTEFNSIKQASLIAIPFFSALISRTLSWLWGCIKPQNAEKILLRRALKRKEKEIKARMHDPDISEDTKNELQRMLADITFKHVNSFDSP